MLCLECFNSQSALMSELTKLYKKKYSKCIDAQILLYLFTIHLQKSVLLREQVVSMTSCVAIIVFTSRLHVTNSSCKMVSLRTVPWFIYIYIPNPTVFLISNECHQLLKGYHYSALLPIWTNPQSIRKITHLFENSRFVFKSKHYTYFSLFWEKFAIF